jgi:hypothetical protein
MSDEKTCYKCEIVFWREDYCPACTLQSRVEELEGALQEVTCTLQARVEELEGALQEVKNLCRMDSTNPTIRSLHSWVSEALEAEDDNTEG